MLVLANASQCLKQFLICPTQFFGVRIGAAAGLAVIGHGIGRKIFLRGIRNQSGIKAFLLPVLVQRNQIIFRAVLVGTANSSKSAARQTLGLEVERLVLSCRLGYEDHDDGLAMNRFRADVQAQRAVEHAGRLAGQIGAELIWLFQSLDFIAREQRHFLPRHAKQQPTTSEPWFISEGADGFQQRFADFGSGLGFDALVLVQQIQVFQQFLCRHSVTSRSKPRIRFSTSASSASISCSGRGGWYWKNTRLKLIS